MVVFLINCVCVCSDREQAGINFVNKHPKKKRNVIKINNKYRARLLSVYFVCVCVCAYAGIQTYLVHKRTPATRLLAHRACVYQLDNSSVRNERERECILKSSMELNVVSVYLTNNQPKLKVKDM